MADVTPPESPASLLERAAQRLEDLESRAVVGPWSTCAAKVTAGGDEQWLVADAHTSTTALWIATMSPVIAAPLAKWLRSSARYVHYERGAVSSEENGREFFEGKYGGAFELARLILGENP